MLKDMTEHFEFSIEERDQALALYTELKEKIAPSLEENDEGRIRSHLLHAIEQNMVKRDVFGLNPIVSSLQTALLLIDEIGLRRDAVLAILLNPSVEAGFLTIDEVGTTYGIAVGRILHRRGGYHLWHRRRTYPARTAAHTGTVSEESRYRERELPQPAAFVCRGYARDSHHDSRPREPDATDQGHGQGGGQAARQ